MTGPAVTVQSRSPIDGAVVLARDGRARLDRRPRVAYRKSLVKTRMGGKLLVVKGAGANLMGMVARLVFSVKCSSPSKDWGTSSDRTKSSTTALRLLAALVSAGS